MVYLLISKYLHFSKLSTREFIAKRNLILATRDSEQLYYFVTKYNKNFKKK